MKKMVKLGVFAALALVLVTGCGSKSNEKVLTCTMTDDSNSMMEMNQTVKATFSKDKATKVNLVMKVKLSDEYKSYAKTFSTMLESQFTKLKDQKGVSYKTDSKDNVITFTLDADLTKMDDEAKDALDIGDTTGTYKETKKAFENEGYKCK